MSDHMSDNWSLVPGWRGSGLTWMFLGRPSFAWWFHPSVNATRRWLYAKTGIGFRDCDWMTHEQAMASLDRAPLSFLRAARVRRKA